MGIVEFIKKLFEEELEEKRMLHEEARKNAEKEAMELADEIRQGSESQEAKRL